MSRLLTCAPCGALFLPKTHRQRSCSRACGRKARPPQPKRVEPPLQQKHYLVLRLLKSQPLERRARGGWRFGTLRIGDATVDRLIARGRAEIRGGKVFGKQTEART